RLAAIAALCATTALAAGPAGLGSPDGGQGAVAPTEVDRTASATPQAEHVDASRATAPGEDGVSVSDKAGASAALSDPPPRPSPTAAPALFAAVSPTDPVQDPAGPSVSSEALDACLDACIDQYLWSLYERTPKVDTVKVEERIKVKV